MLIEAERELMEALDRSRLRLDQVDMTIEVGKSESKLLEELATVNL
jgi:hypothetical protein